MRPERSLTDAEHITRTHELLTHAARRAQRTWRGGWRMRHTPSTSIGRMYTTVNLGQVTAEAFEVVEEHETR
jgi:hypothetical protein